MPDEVDNTQLYLECDDCGEVFESITDAFKHSVEFADQNIGFTIKTEEEAF